MAESMVGVLRVLLTANTAEYKTGMAGAQTATKAFVSEVDKTKAKLGTLEGAASEATAKLKGLSGAFTGQRLFAAAETVTKQIGQIGNVAKLTDSELKRVASTLDKAAEKARLMGQALPPSVTALNDAVKAQIGHLDTATKRTTAWGSALGSVKTIAAGMLAGFGLQTVVSGLGRALTATIAWGDELADLSSKTGINTAALQKWDFAAKQTGTTLDTLINAAQELGKRLADGEKSTAGAVAKLGLNLQTLKAMAPEQQFETIAEALRRVEDAGTQGAIGADLFGKAWKEVIAPIREGLKELGDEAERVGAVIDDETVKAMGELSDSWAALKSSGTGLIASVLRPMVPLLNGMADAARNLAGAFTGSSGFWEKLTLLNRMMSGGLPGLGGAGGALIGAYGNGPTSALPPLPKGPGLPVGPGYQSSLERVALATTFAPLKQATERATKHVEDLSLAAQEASLRWRNIVGTSDLLLARMGQVAMGLQLPGLVPAVALGGQGNPWGGIANTSLLGWGGSTITPQRPGFNWGALGLGGVNAALPFLSQLVTGGSRQSQIGGSIGGGLGGVLGSSSLFGGLKGFSGFAGVLGGVAPFLGPLLGLAGGLIGKLFGPSEGKVTSQARGEWIQSLGGNEAFNERFRQAQVSPEEAKRLTAQLMAAGTAKELKAAQDAIEAALARNNKLLAEQQQTESEILGLEQERARIVDSLKVGYSDVLGIAQKYGIAVEGLGTAINQAGTTANFTQIVNDLEALKRAAEQAGGELDWGGALVGMKDEINALVIDAMRMGTAIPENMRPFLQSLLDAGQLLDANGEKMTDLGDLKWGAAVETDADKANKALEQIDQTLQTLNDTLADLARALRGELPAAAQVGAAGVENALNNIDPDPIEVEVRYNDHSYRPPPEHTAQIYGRGGLVAPQYRAVGGTLLALANAGFRPQGTDTVPAMLTPGELVLTAEQQRSLLGALQASTAVTSSLVGTLARDASPLSGGGDQTIVVIDGRGTKDDVLNRVMAALPRKTRQNEQSFRTLMREALGVTA